MRRKKQKTPSLTGGAGSLNRVNLLGSVFTVNPVYNNLSRLGNSLESGVLVKTPCITIGFCSLLRNVFDFLRCRCRCGVMYA